MSKDLASVGAKIADQRRAWLEQRPPVDVEQRLAEVQAEVSRRSRRTRAGPRRSGLRVGLALAAALSLLGALWILILRGGGEELRAVASGAPLHAGERLVARSRGVDLAFSDGSRVNLEVGSEAMVAGIADHEVRLRLLRGEVQVRVVHRAGRTWWVHGGDHAIEVVGTAFTLRYDVESDQIDVDLAEGKVRAVGPCADGDVVHEAPARFSVGCRGATPAARASSSASAPARPGAEASASAAVGPAPIEAWRAARARGDLRSAFELASDVGLDGVTAGASASELIDLALGARLAGSRAEAVRLYHRTRERFAGSEASATAAFHLGRLAFDEAGAWAEAERWFSIYLAERPGGALAAESLGRSMEAAERQGATDRARGHAAAYLVRFPQGPLAARAQKLVDAGAPAGDGAPRAPP